MVLDKPVLLEELKEKSHNYYPDRIKFCIDRKRKKVAADGEMHIDMEYELIDDGSDLENIFGGDIILEPVSILWESHSNIERNRLLGTGTGRKLADQKVIDELFEILKYWIR